MTKLGETAINNIPSSVQRLAQARALEDSLIKAESKTNRSNEKL